MTPEEAAAALGPVPSYVYAGAESTDARAAYIGTESSRVLDVTDAVVTALLGGGGARIKALEASSGARVIVDKRGEGSRGQDASGTLRRVTLVGSEAALKECERRLGEIVGMTAGAGQASRVLRCNANQAGALIGKGGATIRRLQEASGTRIDVSGRDAGDEVPRSVTIKGLPWAVEAAVKLVYSFMRDPEQLEALLDEAQAATQKEKGSGGAAGAAAGYGDAAQWARQMQ